MSAHQTSAAIDATESAVAGTSELAKAPDRVRTNQFRRNLHRFFIRNRLNLAGVLIVVGFLFLAAFGPLLAPYDSNAQDITD